jgi:hypothetical protein
MNRSTHLWIFGAVVLSLICFSVHGIKFELPAKPEGTPDQTHRRCLANYLGRHVFVRGNWEISKGDHQSVSIEVIKHAF